MSEENKILPEKNPIAIGSEGQDQSFGSAQDKPEPSETNSQKFPEDKQAPAIIESKTINTKQETDNMEVHHHGHVHEKKKWLEYLFQFFMLFLAVFCGFLAEYQLEHRIEKDREKVFIKSFHEDLIADENDLQRIINNLSQETRIADSLGLLMNNINVKTPANGIYMYLTRIIRSSATNLYVNDKTIVQLRNAGGMRLIHNKRVSDSIVGYYKEVEIIQFLNEESLAIKRSLRQQLPTILNAADFAKIFDSTNRIINPAEVLYLRSTDANAINDCLLSVYNIKGLSGGLKIRIQQLKARATRIKKFLKNEYHLKDE